MNRGDPPPAPPIGRRRGGIRQAAAARARRSVEAILQPVGRIPIHVLPQLNAEAVAGMAFAQLVHPGTPVVYGNTIATVSIQSGGPTCGTAETVILGLAVTQLARRYGVPSRTAGMRTGSKTCHADAGAQSIIASLRDGGGMETFPNSSATVSDRTA